MENISKSNWKKQVKEKIRESIEERAKQEMGKKTKAKTIAEDKSERKKYLLKCDSHTIKDVIKIRLHTWQMNCNYKKENTDTKESEDTAKHVLECEKVIRFTFSKKNKEMREVAVIKESR